MNFLETTKTTYGCSYNKKDLIIWCPHDVGSEYFFSYFPEINEILINYYGDDLLNKYINIENDFGSLTLAKKVAENLVFIYPDISITVIASNIPRGIVDCARIKSHALRNIFMPADKKRFYSLLISIYETCLNDLNECLLTLKPNGVLIDLHTMAPCNPIGKTATASEYLIESPNRLAEYVRDYCTSQYQGDQRLIDIITALPNGQVISDKKITESIKQFLTKKNISYAINQPYSSGENLLVKELFKNHRGITIDIPKHYITNESMYHQTFSLANLSLNEKKINEIAEILSEPILLNLPLTHDVTLCEIE